MGIVETLTTVLGAIAFLGLLLYLFYGGLHKTFRRVGFTPGEASIILAGTFIGAFVNVPLFRVGDWLVAVNVGGALVPLAVTFILLRRRRTAIVEWLAATTVVALVTYLVTTATPQGIVSPFPLYLLPPIAAAAMSLGAFWRDEDFAAPIAYMSGTIGTLIGADFFRLGEFLAQTPGADSAGVASIGGAAVLDMVYLTGVVAVGLDALFFSQVRKQADPFPLPYEQHTVFTSATPSEVISAYEPRGRSDTVAPRAPTARAGAREAPRATTRFPTQANTAPPQRAQPTPRPAAKSAPVDDRLARHREWEERLRRGR